MSFEHKMPRKAIPAMNDDSKWFSVLHSVLDGSLLTLNGDAMPIVVRHVDEAPKMPEDEIPAVDDNPKWFSVQRSMLNGSLLTLTEDAIPALVRRVDETPKMPEDVIPAVDDNSKWFSVQRSVLDGSFLTLTGQGHAGLQLDRSPAVSRISQKSQMVVNQSVGLKVPQEGAAQVRKSTNPFEYESDSEANNASLPWMDISSLHAALPDQQWPTAQYGGSNAPWPPDTSFSNFYPSVNQGGLAYVARSSHLLNTPPKSPQDSRGGNPFA